MPDESRLWINGFEQPLGQDERERVRGRLEPFCSTWLSHNDGVTAAFDIWFDRFVVTAAWTTGGISGCSADGLVRNFKQLRDEGVDGLNGGLIFYRGGSGEIVSVDHLAFEDILGGGSIGPDTRVFDTLIQNLGSLREGRFEVPFSESWHSRRFRLAEPAN